MSREVDPELTEVAGLPADRPLQGRNVLSVRHSDRRVFERVFDVARDLRQRHQGNGGLDLLHGRVLANLFFEPSTRTAGSFASAMYRLGGGVIEIRGPHFTSVAKGESFEDTMRAFDAYADVVVLRHPEVGAAKRAAAICSSPVINAGDGAGEHPTQAMLDAFTIHEELGGLDGKTISLVGDLKHGRTVHSLSMLLSHYDVNVNFVSPSSLAMPDDLLSDLSAAGLRFAPHDRLDDVLAESDVVYVTRIQRERFENPADADAVAGTYTFGLDQLAQCKDKMVVMHPLPRIDEIDPACDADPRAAYFRQMTHGVHVRMALLAMVCGRA